MAWPGGYRDGHNDLVSSPAPDFELGTDGPSLIMVGVDGSRTSLRAAAYAAGLARRQRSRLLAVYVGRVPASAAAASAPANGPHAAREIREGRTVRHKKGHQPTADRNHETTGGAERAVVHALAHLIRVPA
jgi:nucleotide-binding universal stress UspA family protein